jgi:hypothetical protein
MDEDAGFRKTLPGFLVAVAVTAALNWFSLPPLVADEMPYLRSGLTVNAVAVIVGMSLAIAASVCAILYFVYARKRAAEQASLHFMILFVVGLAMGGGFVFSARQQAEKEDAQLRIAVQEIDNTLFILAHPGPKIDMTVRASGSPGEIERAVKMMVADVTRERSSFMAEMDTLDIQHILQPSHLAGDKGLVRTRAAIAKARTSLKAYDARTEKIVAQFRNRVAATKVDGRVREQLLSNFAPLMLRAETELKAIMDNANAIITELDAVTNVLAHPKGRWVVQGDNILFANREDLMAYRQHVQFAQTYADQERAALVAASGPITPPY